MKGEFIMNANQINARFEALFNNMKARNAAQFSKDNDITLSLLFKHEKAVKGGMVKLTAQQFDDYIANVVNTEAGSDKTKFVAVKVNVKIARMLAAIGQQAIAMLDEYSQTIIANALHNKGKIFSKSALVCLSKDIEYSEFETSQILKNRMRKAATTASTQRSSSREMLRILDLAECTKGAKGDDITLTDKGVKLLSPLFGIAIDETVSDTE